MKKRKLVYEAGVNDADYVVQVTEYIEERLLNGRKKQKLVWICPYYSRWKGMLVRCYSKNLQDKYPTYKGCTVCVDWLTFSNFRKWMITQVWEDKQLDKDLLKEGNKIYSPETCVFVSREVNVFTIASGKTRGEYLIGCCCWDKQAKKFMTQCSNPFTKKREYLGLFNTELEAHLAWKKRKHELAYQFAVSEYVTDERVKQILLHKYENYTILEDHIK